MAYHERVQRRTIRAPALSRIAEQHSSGGGGEMDRVVAVAVVHALYSS